MIDLLLLSYNNESNVWNQTRTEISKISVVILMTRCEYILKKYLSDEKELGAYHIYIYIYIYIYL